VRAPDGAAPTFWMSEDKAISGVPKILTEAMIAPKAKLIAISLYEKDERTATVRDNRRHCDREPFAPRLIVVGGP
jgi:hypothetical protein